MYLKSSDGMANSVDPSFGFTLFAQVYVYVRLACFRMLLGLFFCGVTPIVITVR